MTKQQALVRLQKQLNEIETIRSGPKFSPEFKKWYRDTEVVIEKIFGDKKPEKSGSLGDHQAPVPKSKPSLDVDMLSAAREQKKVYRQKSDNSFSSVKFHSPNKAKEKKDSPVPPSNHQSLISAAADKMDKPSPVIDFKSIKFDDQKKNNDDNGSDTVIAKKVGQDKKPKLKSFHFGLSTLKGKGKKFKLNINLVPAELAFKDEVGIRRKTIALVLSIIVAGLLVFGAHFTIGVIQKRVTRDMFIKQNEILELNMAVGKSQQGKTETIVLQRKLLSLDKILDNHIRWTKFFTLLEKYTLEGVYYDGMSADINGQLELPVSASSYREGAKQIVVFENADDFIKSIEVGDISLDVASNQGVSGVSFDLKIELADRLLTVVD